MATLNRIRRKRFGEILVGEGLINKEQLHEALELQRNSGDLLGEILLDLGHITESDIIKALSVQYQIPFLRPTLYDLDRKLIGKFKPEFLHSHKFLPIDQIGTLVLLVVTEIPSDEVLAEIQETVQANLAIYLASITEVTQILKEMAPITENDMENIRIRRREAGKGKGTSEVPASLRDARDSSEETPTSESVMTKVLTMDTSWESIFDAAEGNKMSVTPGRPDDDGDGDADEPGVLGADTRTMDRSSQILERDSEILGKDSGMLERDSQILGKESRILRRDSESIDRDTESIDPA